MPCSLRARWRPGKEKGTRGAYRWSFHQLERRPAMPSHAMRRERHEEVQAMLDAIIRKQIDLPLAVIARHALKWRISAMGATVTGFALGLVATALVASQLYCAAAAVFVLSRFCDGMDGAIA